MPPQRGFPWRRLPLEIRLLVLEKLTPATDCLGFVRTRGSGLAALSIVCREWQEFIEDIIFYRLILHQNDLGRFAKLTPRHMNLVRHLWLRVEVPTGESPGTEIRLRSRGRKKGMRILGNALLSLFEVLHRWETTGGGQDGGTSASKPGLVLEVSCQLLFNSGPYAKTLAYEEIDLSDEDDDVPLPADYYYRQLASQRAIWTPWGPLRILLEGLMALRSRRTLPQVNSVRHLLIRRYTRPRIFPPVLQRMFRSLPGLQTVQYEASRTEGHGIYESHDEGR